MPLSPGFVDDGGMERFQCEFGWGLVQADFKRRRCAIYEFSAKHGGGNGRQTLQWLHQFFNKIDVIDPGTKDDALPFWEKMRAEGLVNVLRDNEGRPIRRRHDLQRKIV